MLYAFSCLIVFLSDGPKVAGSGNLSVLCIAYRHTNGKLTGVDIFQQRLSSRLKNKFSFEAVGLQLLF